MNLMRVDRKIHNRYFRIFLRAVGEEIGEYSLELVLRDAGLDCHADQLTSTNGCSGVHSSEVASVHAAIRSYFGSGARGTLSRIGRLVWQYAIAETFYGSLARLGIKVFLPKSLGTRAALNMVAGLMRKPDGHVSVHLYDTDLIFMDTTSDITFGQDEENPICWYTVGLIQACLLWATGKEIDVEEISCRAVGADTCKFEIDL